MGRELVSALADLHCCLLCCCCCCCCCAAAAAANRDCCCCLLLLAPGYTLRAVAPLRCCVAVLSDRHCSFITLRLKEAAAKQTCCHRRWPFVSTLAAMPPEARASMTPAVTPANALQARRWAASCCLSPAVEVLSLR